MKTIKKFILLVWEIVKITAIAALIVIPIRYFLFQPFFVKGDSMDPNFANGDYLIVDEISYRFRLPQRGEVVVFDFPLNPSQRFIKRVIGLPGETVEVKNGTVSIQKDGKTETLNETAYLDPSLRTVGDLKITLGEKEFFVMGDNRDYSYDSRKFGILPEDKIIGRVVLKAWPFAVMAKVDVPSY